MFIQLIQGQFNVKDAIHIITKMIEVKIKYHEDKIELHENEEDIKYRETKIKTLQKSLQETRDFLLLKNDKIIIDGVINIS